MSYDPLPYVSRRRSRTEIDTVLERCAQAERTGRSRYPNESYEAGVRTAINWLLNTGYDPEPLFED